MPNIKSAKKRVAINAKKNTENRMIRSQMNTAIKKYNNAIDTNKVDEAEALLPVTMGIIDKTVAKGVIHKNNAANKKSALAKRLSDIKSGKIVVQIKKDNKTIASEKARAAQAARDEVKAENAKKAAERKAAKIDAEKAKLEAEGKGKKVKAKDEPKKAVKEAKEVKAKAEPKKEEGEVKKAAKKKAEPKAEKKTDA